MKIEIPDAVKADMPANRWGKILATTPVIMAVVSTLLAGLASGEMTKAQYARSLAAQQQAKAGDQWGLFQAKRIRSALQTSTKEILTGQGPVIPLDGMDLGQRCSGFGPAGATVAAVIARDDGPVALQALANGILPDPPAADERIQQWLSGGDQPWEDDAALRAAIAASEARATAYDAAVKPVLHAVDRAQAAVAALPGNQESSDIRRSVTVARLTLLERRYEQESRLYQDVARLWEVAVERSNAEAERHHRRSQRFFYGMLATQCAVIIATMAMAARNRNLLWSIAAGAGLTATVFASYVYVCM